LYQVFDTASTTAFLDDGGMMEIFEEMRGSSGYFLFGQF
jgi:hypothetical protein